ncbi:alcohol dehydrogenase catalytic domain-containing protein, partial [bacterium]|nr:alcohol dehydrogenase catalytic domain-containing protein [bacterium]
MKRLFIDESGIVKIKEVPNLEIGGNEVLVKIKACSICGGDIKIYKGIKEGVLKKDLPYPLSGHEWSGEIVKVGNNISNFRIGDRVARCFSNYCGFCINCRLGMPNFCIGIKEQEHSGGFAEFAKFYVPPIGGSGLFKIPEGISYESAALAEPGTCAIGATLKVNIHPGDFVAVIGLGGLGQLISQRISAYQSYVIGIDINESKLKKASQWCKYTINSSTDNPVKKVLEITG